MMMFSLPQRTQIPVVMEMAEHTTFIFYQNIG